MCIYVHVYIHVAMYIHGPPVKYYVYMYSSMVHSLQKRTGLRAGDKERAWCEVLSLLHPRSRRIHIPDEDDFDPDTYGRPQPVVEPCETATM